ncbi:hypothetical protein [Streptomyces sp. NPDC056713]|uniref:hypothetical protein n=1 Tax=Streptomyces sp. NPDC056713 TaxID=3345921 RepID=UPI0036A6E9E2
MLAATRPLSLGWTEGHQLSTSMGHGERVFEPRPFLTWAARRAGSVLGVEAAVLFDVHELIPEGPPPWV